MPFKVCASISLEVQLFADESFSTERGKANERGACLRCGKATWTQLLIREVYTGWAMVLAQNNAWVEGGSYGWRGWSDYEVAYPKT